MYYEPMTLCHHGIKGQKWGIRRFQNKDGSLTAAGKKRYDEGEVSSNAKVVASRKEDIKNRRTLSDADIKKKIDRLKLEKNLKDLTEEDISPGKKKVKEILAKSGEKVVTAAVAGAMAYGVKVAMTKKFDMKEAADYVASNPNKKK